MPSVLIVDDELNTREVLGKYLKNRFEVTLADSGERAISLLQSHDFDLVLTDLRMPGTDGMSVLEATLSKGQYTPCVVFTAYGSIENAVKAVKAGAADFVAKPVKLNVLDEVIARVLQEKSAVSGARKEKSAMHSFMPVMGSSTKMKELTSLLMKVAASRSTVLITGESGTGKEVAARLIHNLSGRTGLFVPIHCAALPGNLLESELFGHEKGAFTGALDTRKGRFELADKGTILLDEVGEIDEHIQIKLLRVLESKTIERIGSADPIVCDARVIAATNRDLKQMVKDGKFREDLFYRINVVSIELPPLRERREDIPEFADRFLRESAEGNGKEVMKITPAAMTLLQNYNWPGNIRELKNCIERMVVFAAGTTLDTDDLPLELRSFSPAAAMGTLESHEREQILKALEQCGGNRTRTADALGISRRTLLRRLKDYGISF